MNLKELSAHLGLSQTTVSRALNGYPEVGEATRLRVMEAASRFGYRPSPAARRLATGTAHALGIVFPVERNVLLDPLFVEFLAGVSETAGRNNFDILISPTTSETEIATYGRLVRSGTVDAVIISSPAVDDPRIVRIGALGFPAVVHGRAGEGLDVVSLDIDNRGAFLQATRFLLQLGHRRIALVNGDERFTFAVDRRAGTLDAFAEAGNQPSLDLFSAGPMTMENGYRAARAALAGEGPPTAFLCGSILVALGVLKAVAESGLEVPGDISIIAHDDEMPAFRADQMMPPLTTTRSSIRAAGARVAEMALAQVTGEVLDQPHEVWPVELIVRASTAPPPVR
nr:substrate-binding domain-containing protein [Chthonobacter albigriseus]